MTTNPGGRPEIGPKITFRLREETLASVNALAGAAGKSRSIWLRELVEREIARLTRQP